VPLLEILSALWRKNFNVPSLFNTREVLDAIARRLPETEGNLWGQIPALNDLLETYPG